MTSKPTVLIACREFGIPSEVWMLRQSSGFKSLDARYLCWEIANKIEPYPVASLGYSFDAQEFGIGKWLRRLLQLPSGNLFAPNAKEQKTLLDLITREGKPDAILCHYGHVGLRMLPLAKKLNIPIVVHFHGNDISSALRNRYYRWSLQRSLSKFSACVAVGNRQIENLKALGGDPEKIHLIPCGAPSQSFTPKPDYQADVCKFITVSRLVPWKGVDIVLQAFDSVHQHNPNTELHIVGDGNQLNLIKNMRENSPAWESIFVHGVKDQKTIHNMLLESDVFIQHSLDHETGWFEGFGVSITEASLTGLPVVVTASGGIADQIIDGYNGIYVGQRSVSETSAAMKKLADSAQLRQTMGENGRTRALEHYDSSMLAEKLEQLILNIS